MGNAEIPVGDAMDTAELQNNLGGQLDLSQFNFDGINILSDAWFSQQITFDDMGAF